MATFRLVVTPEAELDIAKGYRWYEEQARLGNAFVAAVDERFAHISSYPWACPVVEQDIRRALIRRFPYNAYYTINGHVIHILAVWHGQMDQRRLLASRLGPTH